MPDSFFEIERRYYAEHYQHYCDGQHERNRRSGHSKRDRTTDELHADKRTAPEENYIQLGNMDEHESPEVLLAFIKDYFAELEEKYGDHVHVIDWALHVDEKTPHIHVRQVFDCENQYGEIAPQQNKALKLMGFERPDLSEKESKLNNPKMTFDANVRELMMDLAERHGVDVIREPVAGGHDHMEKNDYIQMRQKQRIEEQVATIKTQIEKISENKDELLDLKMKISDAEKLIDEVTDAAYEKAVDAVAEQVQIETHNADLKEIQNFKTWLLSSERKDPKEKREYAARRMDGLGERIKKSFQKVRDHIRNLFRRPEKKREVMQPVKESLLKQLRENQKIVETQKATKKSQPKKSKGAEL